MSAMPVGGGLPDFKIVNTHILPEQVLGYLGPVALLHGFDALLGLPPSPNGFNFQGVEVDALGGSYGHVQGLAQAGQQYGNFAAFAAFGVLNDDGWQQHSPSRTYQFHGDLGYRNEGNEYHLTAHYLKSSIMGSALSPVQLVEADPTAQLNYPQGFDNKSLHLNFSGSYALGDGWTAQSNIAVSKTRSYQYFTPGGFQVPVGGCMGNATKLCSGSTPYMNINGTQFDNVLLGTGKAYATLDTQLTETTSWAASLSATNRGDLAGRPNSLIVGANYNGAESLATFHQYLGVFNSDGGFGPNLGETNTAPGGQPQRVRAGLNFLDLYATDELALTDRLKIALGGRFDHSAVNQHDLWGTTTTATQRQFNHFSPSVGVTYALTPALVAYGNYWQHASVLTPAGMFCEDPESACSTMAPWFGTNQILNQSVAYNYELGLRGQLPTLTPLRGIPVQIAWNAALYRTDISDYDYLALSTGAPSFTDVGKVRKQGVKAGIEIITEKLTTAIAYTYTDARFLSSFSLWDPPNTGSINNIEYVTPGKVVPVEPNHMLKVATSYRLTDRLNIGASARAASGSYYFSDEINVMGKTPGYVVFGFNTQYHVNENLEVFGIAENIFNKQYVVLGGLLPTSLIPLTLLNGGTNPRSWAVGQPASVYGGIRYKF